MVVAAAALAAAVVTIKSSNWRPECHTRISIKSVSFMLLHVNL